MSSTSAPSFPKDIPWTTVAQDVEVGIDVKRWSGFCGQLVWSIYETTEII